MGGGTGRGCVEGGSAQCGSCVDEEEEDMQRGSLG